MADPSEKLQIVIANRLRDGLTVFLAGNGVWAETIGQAVVARTDEDAARLLQLAEAAAADNVVVGPYLIRVTQYAGALSPVEWREAIRASGPTVETRADA
jgi:hypothetical protein